MHILDPSFYSKWVRLLWRRKKNTAKWQLFCTNRFLAHHQFWISLLVFKITKFKLPYLQKKLYTFDIFHACCRERKNKFSTKFPLLQNLCLPCLASFNYPISFLTASHLTFSNFISCSLFYLLAKFLPFLFEINLVSKLLCYRKASTRVPNVWHCIVAKIEWKDSILHSSSFCCRRR